MVCAVSRECGDCSACCTHGGVPEIAKPPGQPCPHDCGGCDIYATRPQGCRDFVCAWLRGVGAESDRPDKSGVILSINDLNGGTFAFATECHAGAAMGSGAAMVWAMADCIPLPVVVNRFETKYPNDSGDWVAVRDELLPQTTQMRGPVVGPLGDALTVYALVKGA